MVADAVLAVVKYGHNFNLEKSNNAFAWVTQVVHNAMIRYITVEHKATFTTMLYSESVEHPYLAECRESNQDHESFIEWKGNIQTGTLRKRRKKPESRIDKVGKLMVEGFTEEQIAEKLGLTRQSVKTCITRYRNNNGMAAVATRKSKYKGVSWMPDCNRWRSQVRINTYMLHLGSFANEEDAARAFDEAVVKYELRRKLNFPVLSAAA
jgi:DNA-directed RNA polymerase specialized sigma24 family protein